VSALTLELPADVLARVQAAARQETVTMGDWIERAVTDKLRSLLPPSARKPDPPAPCRHCGAPAERGRRGLCGACRARTRTDHRRLILCATCGRERPVATRGLCAPCAARERRAGLRHCRGCQSYQPEFAKGLCSACYQRERRTTQRAALERAG
jgi:hypothetical protein